MFFSDCAIVPDERLVDWMSTNALGETRGLDGLLADVLANLLAGRPL